jgi:thiamine-monophosphate kinase
MRSEFEFIQQIKKNYSLKSIGDDCAVLPKDAESDLVITADLLVQGVDFRLEWTTPEFLGHKALAVSLSDIAAMGARPKWAMLSLAVSQPVWNSDFIDEFYEGWHRLAAEFGVELVGGDVSRSPDRLVIDSIVGGEVPNGKAILRSAAKPGDSIFVTGELGGAAAGLRLLNQGHRYAASNSEEYDSLLLKQLEPIPQVNTGILLQEQRLATAMIDVSDGISSDLAHICVESAVGAKIYADRIPIRRDLKSIFKSPNEQLDMALNGGEDFELLFTADQNKISQLKSPNFTCIGAITASIGTIELVRNGRIEILQPKGYRHF